MNDDAPLCLAVEDDADLRYLIARTAQRLGMRVVECGSLDDVTVVLVRQVPNLIFLDMGLINSDGSDVLALLARYRCQAWVQLISGRAHEELEAVEEEGDELGLRMLSPLTKPFHAGAIRAVVEGFGAGPVGVAW